MTLSGAVMVEDLANGLNEWRNIQDVVRVTFKALVDTVRAQDAQLRTQGDSIARLERMLEQKANRAEVQGNLSQKANGTDVNALNRRISELNRVLDAKADAAEVASMMEKKADLSEVADQLSEIMTQLDTKAAARDVETYLDRKADAQEMAVQLDKKADRLELQGAIAGKAATVDVQKVARALDAKANLVDVNALLEQVARSVENVSAELNVKADAQDVAAELEKKCDMAEVRALLDSKANIVDVNESLNLKANKDSVVQALQRKANKKETEELIDQKASIADVNAVLAKKADTDLVTVSLNGKANKSDVEQLFEAKAQELSKRLLKEIHTRPSRGDFDAKNAQTDAHLAEMQITLAGKAQQSDVSQLAKDLQISSHDLASRLATRVTETDMHTALDRLHLSIQQSQKAVLSEVDAQLANRVTNGALADQLKNTMLLISEQQAGYRAAERAEDREIIVGQLHHQLAQKADHAEVDDLLDKLERVREACIAELEDKVNRQQFHDAISRINDAVNQEFINVTAVINTKVDLTTLEHNLNTTVAALESSVADALRKQNATMVTGVEDNLNTIIRDLRNEMDAILERKPDAAEVSAALSKKLDRAAVPQLQDEILSSDRFTQVVESRSGAGETRQLIDAMRAQVEGVNKELLMRATIRDVCRLLDEKANIDDVNAALSSFTGQLTERTGAAEGRRDDNERMFAAVFSEFAVGRWLWKTGKTKNGHGVPWNVQSVNTQPENLIWEKDKVNIIVMQPGLYEVTFGFYADSKPAVQLLVNGEPVLSAVNSASYVIHHSSGRIASVDSHPEGNITGLTLIDFIALPPKARVALSYNGEPGAQGFLSLRKL